MWQEWISQSTYIKLFRDVSAYCSRVCVGGADMLQWSRITNTVLEIHLMIFILGAGAVIGLIQAYDSTRRG